MLIRIEQGKGGKDRYVMLSPQLPQILRAYWRLARPGRWLFPGCEAGEPVSVATLQEACRIATRRAELANRLQYTRCGIVSLLVSWYGTHLFFAVLENGQTVDPLGVLPPLRRLL